MFRERYNYTPLYTFSKHFMMPCVLTATQGKVSITLAKQAYHCITLKSGTLVS